MKKQYAACAMIGILACSTPHVASADGYVIPLPSAWQLEEVTPVSLMDSSPTGLANHREYYSEDGKICIIGPNETLTENEACFEVSFDKNTRSIVDPENDEPTAAEFSWVDGRLIFRFPDATEFRLRPISIESLQSRVRPESLLVVNIKEESRSGVPEVMYVDASQPGDNRSLVGVWETIQHVMKFSPDLPPYGMPNRKWVFTKTHVALLEPEQTEPDADGWRPYVVDGTRLSLSDEGHLYRFTFDEWGDLILHVDDKDMIRLRQVSLNPEEIPALPSKIALLELYQ